MPQWFPQRRTTADDPPSGDLQPTTLEEPPVLVRRLHTPHPRQSRNQPGDRPGCGLGGAVLLVVIGFGLYWIFGRQGPESPAGPVEELAPSQEQPVDSLAEAITQAQETAVSASGPGDD